MTSWRTGTFVRNPLVLRQTGWSLKDNPFYIGVRYVLQQRCMLQYHGLRRKTLGVTRMRQEDKVCGKLCGFVDRYRIRRYYLYKGRAWEAGPVGDERR